MAIKLSLGENLFQIPFTNNFVKIWLIKTLNSNNPSLRTPLYLKQAQFLTIT